MALVSCRWIYHAYYVRSTVNGAGHIVCDDARSDRHKIQKFKHPSKVPSTFTSNLDHQPTMWPFTSTPSASQTVASDLNPTPGPSTQAPPTTPIPPTPVTQGRLNIPSGNSQITPSSIDAEEDKLTGDKWTDYKAAFEVRLFALKWEECAE